MVPRLSPNPDAPPKAVEYQDVAIDDILVDDDRLKLGDEDITALADSIKTAGLIEPVVVRRRDDKLVLVAGFRRMQACKGLGWTAITAIIFDQDTPDHWHELAEIDENLMRRELSPAQRTLLTIKRKSVYEAMHPETKHGKGKGRNVRSFADNTASSTGRSRGDIQRDATRGKQLGESDVKRVIGTSLDNGAELDALRKLPVEDREPLIKRAIAGEQVTARKKPLRGELAEVATRFALLFKHAEEDDRLEFMDAPIAATIKRLLIEGWSEPPVECDRSPKMH